MRNTSRAARRILTSAVAVLALLATTLGPLPATGVEPCTDPPPVIGVDRLVPGTTGTGYTVVQGRDPVRFRVEILGVLEDGIAPGLDFILIQTSGKVIKETGGIAAGFSGSPVYIKGKLAGAISYGFSAADQTIGGMTPAASMLQILGYPGRASAVPAAVRPAKKVGLGSGLQRKAARAAGVTRAAFPSTARQLPIPLGISGLNRHGMEAAEQLMDDSRSSVIPYRAGRASPPGTLASEPLQPGDSFAAMLSYGDLTAGGVGTTTAVCGSYVLAFGHPFYWEGRTGLGMNGAEVLKVVPDPSQTWGGFKIAAVAEPHGRVDQDRLAGLRGIEGSMPAVGDVSSDVLNLDLGRGRHGYTAIARQDWYYYLSALHLLSNLDSTFDRIGEGTSTVEWTVTGLRESGEPFQLTRRNMYYSQWDITYESIFEIYYQLRNIQQNRFEDVTLTDLDIDASLTQDLLTARIRKVFSSSSLKPVSKERSRLTVAPGDVIRLDVRLRLSDGMLAKVPMSLDVPTNAREGGRLYVRGGGGFSWRGPKADSFDDLLDKLAAEDHSYDLVADLGIALRGGGRRHVKAVEPQDNVVRGKELIRVTVVR